jgi:aspartate/methionine/tyrosine aminotransferase
MELLGKNKSALDNFLQSRSDLETHGYSCVTVAFPKLKYGSANDFCVLLRDRYETSVVPGHFFEMPEHFRIGIGGEPEMVAEGLERVGHALDDFRSRWRE